MQINQITPSSTSTKELGCADLHLGPNLLHNILCINNCYHDRHDPSDNLMHAAQPPTDSTSYPISDVSRLLHDN